MKRWPAIFALLLTVFAARAHEVRPAFLELTERARGEFDVLWKVPAMGGTPLAGEELPHPQPALADDPDAPKTMPRTRGTVFFTGTPCHPGRTSRRSPRSR